MKKDYYETVSDYYDEDANLGFEDRAQSNPGLERIRNAFRSYIEKVDFEKALEIGCGPGFDAEWLAGKYSERSVVASDVSKQMCDLSEKRLRPFSNAKVMQVSDADLGTFEPSSFGLVYVFFGALNTVDNLQSSANKIYDVLEPGGHAVLTFVNKWYLREMVVQLLKLRFRSAMARIRKIWGGYSTSRFLPSTCYSPSDVRAAFSKFEEKDHQGYSILFPAWYNYGKFAANPEKAERLWELDERINRTPFWKFGEYTLFVLRKPLS